MKVQNKRIFTSAAFLTVGVLGAGAQAATVSASDNATVQAAGPRTGTNGKAFFDTEGDTSGGASFASYGILDFPTATLPSNPTSLTLALSESNAAFSSAGAVDVFLATVDTGNIQPGTSTVPAYQLGLTPEGIGATNAFGTLYSLGQINFLNLANGTIDSLTTLLDSAEQGVINSDITGGTVIRLILTSDAPTVSSTFAGATNTTTTTPPPSLTLISTAVPEPASTGVILGAMSLLGLRRRK